MSSNIWESVFSSRSWGQYPPEDLVRSATLNSRSLPTPKRVLELGCGPGANSLFLSSLYDHYAAIDFSPSAIDQTRNRLANVQISTDLHVGSFVDLPWPSSYFDLVVDNFSLYANNLVDISSTLSSIKRVLKPNSLFFSKTWGVECCGLEKRFQVSPFTYNHLEVGPCAGFGLSTFFDLDLINRIYKPFFKSVIISERRIKTVGMNDMIHDFILHCHS